ATLSLKSTSTSVTWPDTWLPTVTVEIALSVPVAEIATRMSPPSTVAVRHWPWSAAPRWDIQYQPASAARAATTTPARRRRLLREEAGLLRGWLMREVRESMASTRTTRGRGPRLTARARARFRGRGAFRKGRGR